MRSYDFIVFTAGLMLILAYVFLGFIIRCFWKQIKGIAFGGDESKEGCDVTTEEKSENETDSNQSEEPKT